MTRSARPGFSFKNPLPTSQLSELLHRFGHEVDNPLTAVISLSTILGRLSLTPQEAPSQEEKVRNYSGNILTEAWRVSALTNRLVLLLSDRVLSDVSTDFVRTFSTCLAKFRDREEFDNIEIDLRMSSGKPLAALDGMQLNVLLIELLQNAHEHCAPSAAGQPSIRISIDHDPDAVILTVENVSDHHFAEELSQAFELFSTGKPTLKRLGIGLPVSWAILERIGGSIEIGEEEVDGLHWFKTEVRIPCVKASSLEADQLELPSPLNILVVENESMVSTAIRKILELTLKVKTNVNCTIASGQDVVPLLKPGANFHAVLCDFNLKEMSGRQVFEIVRQQLPEKVSKFAFITGELIRGEATQYFKATGRPCLKKPFEPLELTNLVIGLALGQYPATDRFSSN